MNKFKRNRIGSYLHLKTHVEIELLTNINISDELVKNVFETVYKKDNFKIASPSALVALKLESFRDKDIKDIKLLYENFNINLDYFMNSLSKTAIENIEKLKNIK